MMLNAEFSVHKVFSYTLQAVQDSLKEQIDMETIRSPEALYVALQPEARYEMPTLYLDPTDNRT